VYYENANLTGPATIHIDPEIRFNWGREFPSSMTRSITPVKPNTYTVRLYFAEPDNCKPEERVFSVIIQGKPLLIDLDIATEADGLMKTIIKEFRGIRIEKELILEFKPKSGQTLICGIELIADCTDTDR
ncbi:MAG: hypothetical protein KAH23_02125, partial [Kiritimatiellae bacterium]|nr:hypothetical protein [Kiritimatiellia bacterium]